MQLGNGEQIEANESERCWAGVEALGSSSSAGAASQPCEEGGKVHKINFR